MKNAPPGAFLLMFSLKAFGAIYKIAVCHFIKSLVCLRRLQSAFLIVIRTEFYIIEVVDIHWLVVSSGIPGDLKFQSVFYVMCQSFHLVFRSVTTHDAYAGDVATINLNESIQFVFSEFGAYILPQMRAVAGRAMIRAVGEVNRQTHLVGNLLKDDVVVVVLQHLPLS